MQAPGPSQMTTISGTIVGLLDPTQAARLLSTPQSKLSFATFHPRAASASARKLSVNDELCSNKRVVIETLPTGERFWRWVPRAKGVDNVADEGSWPRVISICGTLVECSQEQWDIYKLDPSYDCVVYPAPQLPTVTRRHATFHSQTAEPASSGIEQHKRHVEDNHGETLPATKKRRPIRAEDYDAEEDSDSDEEAVEEMIIDDVMPGGWRDKKAKFHRKVEEDRQHRRQRNAEKARDLKDTSDLSMIDLTIDDPPPQNINTDSIGSQSSTAYSQTSSTPYSTATSTAYSTTSTAYSSQSSQSQSKGPDPTAHFAKRAAEDSDDDDSPAIFKRARTGSPTKTTSKKDDITRKRQEMKKRRVVRNLGLLSERRQARERAFVESLRTPAPTQSSSLPESQPNTYSQSEHTASSHSQSQSPFHSQPPYEEDPVSLEEKIRRIAEINAYEEARLAKEAERLRAEQIAAEKRRKQEEQWAREQAKAERDRQEREAEQARRKRQQQEEEERRRRQQEEQARRAARQHQEERWSYGTWTTQRALERYKVLSEAFDNAKFSSDDPLTLLAVPWPVLHNPAKLTIQDIDWSAVEAFFKAIRLHMRTQDYRTLVEKSHRRFHPDRWRARRVLQSVQDDELKECLEVAANTVAQALTPLWRDVKSI